jgi:hypothetical protein
VKTHHDDVFAFCFVIFQLSLRQSKPDQQLRPEKRSQPFKETFFPYSFIFASWRIGEAEHVTTSQVLALIASSLVIMPSMTIR